MQKKSVPTGLMFGQHVWRAQHEALAFEEKIFEGIDIHAKGLRRAAIVFPSELHIKYDAKALKTLLSFKLPKSSYATIFLENIANKRLFFDT